jgi:SAM-dependent methyltransferase
MDLKHAIALIGNDHLVKDGATTWADLGCGTGLFTQALASFLQPGSRVYAVDTDKEVLAKMEPLPKGIVLEKLKADFVGEALPFQELDGILMANALHYVGDQPGFLSRAENWLKPEGCFLLVEYDTGQANPWVPYPLSFARLKGLFADLGWQKVKPLGERPSIFRRSPIYSALVYKR